MSDIGVAESVVEQAALAWLEGLDWRIAHGPEIAPETLSAERVRYSEVVLEHRLRNALARLNPDLPATALEDAFRKLIRPEGPSLQARNRVFHGMLVSGVAVEYRTDDGAIRGAQVSVVDFERPANNDWLAIKPIHRRREQARASTRRGPTCQRAAAWRDRAQEPGGRGRNDLDRLATASNPRGRTSNSVLYECDAYGLGRREGANGHVDRRSGMVQALAHNFGGDLSRSTHAPIASDARRGVHAAPLPQPPAGLHCV